MRSKDLTAHTFYRVDKKDPEHPKVHVTLKK